MILGQPLIFKRARILAIPTKIAQHGVSIRVKVEAEFQREHAAILRQESFLYDENGIRRAARKVELDVELERTQMAMRPYEGDSVFKLVAGFVHSMIVLEPKNGSGPATLQMIADYEGDPMVLLDFVLNQRTRVFALGVASAQEKLDLRPRVEDDVTDPAEPMKDGDGSVKMKDAEGQEYQIDESVWSSLVTSISKFKLDGPSDDDEPAEGGE